MSTTIMEVPAQPLHHEPVMVAEVLEAMALRPGAVVADGTLGLGGHASRMCEGIAPGGTLVGLDWDASMLEVAASRLERFADVARILVHRDYRGLREEAELRGLSFDAILLDLGLNSAQIEDPSRGIAFKTEGPLDMRMDREAGEPASALLNRMSPIEIENMLFELGDERWARRIAQVIVERRKTRPLRTTTDLVDAVLEAIPPKARDKRIHPATRTFQAVRLKVTHELEGLADAFRDAASVLAPGGRLVILSYHSGEDRAAKQALRELAAGGDFEEGVRRPLVPTAEEIARNPRSRSAKMRWLVRTTSQPQGSSLGHG